MKNIKIFILGAPKVGKTSIIHQIVFGTTRRTHMTLDLNPPPTIEDVYFATLDVTATQVNPQHHADKAQSRPEDRILFFDIAGIKPSIDIESMRTHINCADEFVLVYSINDRSTFNLVDTIKKLIDQYKGKRDHPVIVLGNKVDLDHERQVDFDEALVWAKRENIKLFEVTSHERVTLLDFTRYLSVQLSSSQNHHHHTTSSFKLRFVKS
jgi:small GTP-binding protein